LQIASSPQFDAIEAQPQPSEKQLPSKCPDCASAELSAVGPCQAPAELNAPGMAAGIQQKMQSSILYACKSCGLNFRFPQLSAGELESLYRGLPSTHWTGESGPNESWALARAHLLAQFSELASPAVLDVGAFTGGFLKSLPNGWRKSAIEPSMEAGDALAFQGVELIAHFLHEDALASHQGEYDAITMLDVLEHVESPFNAVERLAYLLKPGGVILISTGNTRHWSWRLLKGNNWYLHSMQHCSFVNKFFFRNLARSLTLKIRRVIYHSHQRPSGMDRFRQSVEVLFAWGKSQSGFIRKAAGCLVYVPGFGYLRHKTSPPFSNGLRDHLLVALEKY